FSPGEASCSAGITWCTRQACCYSFVLTSCFTSGSPATEVSRDSTPARTAVESTVIQFTSLSRADASMVPIQVREMVCTARTPAAFHHSFHFSLIYHQLLSPGRGGDALPP